MTVITGEERDRYLAVLAEYRFVGFVVWLEDARRQLRVFLPEHNQLSIGELLHSYTAFPSSSALGRTVIILHAAINETSSKRWKLSVMRLAKLPACFVGS